MMKRIGRIADRCAFQAQLVEQARPGTNDVISGPSPEGNITRVIMPRLRRGRSQKRQPSQCRNGTQKLDLNHAEPAYDHTYCYFAPLGKKQ